MSEFEMRLHEHAARVEEYMAAPFDNEKEWLTMTKNNTRSAKMKISLIAIAAVFLLGTTAFAAGTMGGWFSYSDKEYAELPTEQEFIEDIGYAPVLIQEFENGYSYSGGYAENNEVSDGDTVIDRFKSAMFMYEKDGETIYFNQVKANSKLTIPGEVMAKADGADIYYYCYTNKVVPADYELSEEDKAAEESGELVFSYGSDKVETVIVESVQWVKDGVNYILMQTDGALSPDELCAMAKEAIAK